MIIENISKITLDKKKEEDLINIYLRSGYWKYGGTNKNTTWFYNTQTHKIKKEDLIENTLCMQ